MPALPAVPNVLRIDTFYQLAEDLKAKTRQFWKYASGPPTTAELDVMASAVRLAFSTNLADHMFHVYSMIETIITDLSSSSGAVGSNAIAVAGANMGAALSADVCTLQSLELTRRYRGGHPRTYWPFGTGDDLHDNQTWSSTYVAEVGADLDDYKSAVDSAINVWGVSQGQVNVSYFHGSTVFIGPTGRARNISTVRVTPLVDIVVNDVVRAGVAVQRNRNLHLA